MSPSSYRSTRPAPPGSPSRCAAPWPVRSTFSLDSKQSLSWHLLPTPRVPRQQRQTSHPGDPLPGLLECLGMARGGCSHGPCGVVTAQSNSSSLILNKQNPTPASWPRNRAQFTQYGPKKTWLFPSMPSNTDGAYDVTYHSACSAILRAFPALWRSPLHLQLSCLGRLSSWHSLPLFPHHSTTPKPGV